MNYSSFAGFPAPLTNGGLNEHHVAARDIWSPSRKELRAMTPRPQTGLNYSDLSRIALERARTAREAVAQFGQGGIGLLGDQNEQAAAALFVHLGGWSSCVGQGGKGTRFAAALKQPANPSGANAEEFGDRLVGGKTFIASAVSTCHSRISPQE